MIALIAAVPLETELLRRELAPCEVRRCGGQALYHGTLAGQGVALQHSGVGKANAAATTALLLDSLRPEAVLCFGCAGAYLESGLKVGDLVLASEEVYGDEGAADPGRLPRHAEAWLPAGRSAAASAGSTAFRSTPNLLAHGQRLIVAGLASAAARGRRPPGHGVDLFGKRGGGRQLARRTGGLGENMEGAAVAQLCARFGVPFFEVRGISNLVEDRDLSRWDLPGRPRRPSRPCGPLLAGWGDRQEPA